MNADVLKCLSLPCAHPPLWSGLDRQPRAAASGTAKALLMERATGWRELACKAFHRATVDLPKRTHRTAVRLTWNVAPLPATSRTISRWFGAIRPL